MRRLLVGALALVAGLSEAAQFQYYVVPLQGITGISQSAGSAPGTEMPGGRYGGMINARYADAFYDAPAQKELIAQFNQAVVQAFPTSVIGPNQVVTAGRSGKYAYEPYEKAQCSPNFRVGYRDAFAVAVGISRLSAYINDYGDFTQALVPVTYTVRFVKLNGASVIFSKSETIYTQLATTSKDFYAPGSRDISPDNLQRIRQALLADGKLVVNRLVGQARQNFQPKQTAVTLVGRDGPYFIFDRGSEVGFSSNTEHYPQDDAGKEYGFVVKYATDRLAVAVASSFSKEVAAATNGLREGAKLTFSFESPGKDDAKLSVMAVPYVAAPGQSLAPEHVLDNALQSVLVDDLGFSAPFNLIKQDADFARLKNQIRGEANCESTLFQAMPGFADASTDRRADPDFFLKVSHYDSPVFTAAGVGGTTTNTIFTNAVTLSLVDRSGVVRQSFLGSSPYELVRTAGKGLSVEQALEVNLKNAGQAALKQWVASFNPRQRTIGLTAVEAGTATLASPVSPLAFGQARLVRPLRVASLNKTVLLPIPRSGEDGVILEAPSQPTNKLAFRGRALKASDLLVLSGAGDAANLIKPCSPARNGRFLMHASLKSASGADKLLVPVVGAALRNYELLEPPGPFIASAESALRDGLFQSERLAQPPETPLCFLPMELQQLPKVDCASGKCTGSATVASGVRLFNEANKVGESNLAATFEVKDIPDGQLSGFVGLKAFEHHLKSLDAHKSKLQ